MASEVHNKCVKIVLKRNDGVQESMGTGFVLASIRNPNGNGYSTLLCTALHVVEQWKTHPTLYYGLVAYGNETVEYPFVIIASIPRLDELDIALLVISPDLRRNAFGLVRPEVGIAHLFGFPNDLPGLSETSGKVTRPPMDSNVLSKYYVVPYQPVGELEYVEHTAASSTGSSGGPLTSPYYNAMAVHVSALVSFGFAVSITSVANVLRQHYTDYEPEEMGEDINCLVVGFFRRFMERQGFEVDLSLLIQIPP